MGKIKRFGSAVSTIMPLDVVVPLRIIMQRDSFPQNPCDESITYH